MVVTGLSLRARTTAASRGPSTTGGVNQRNETFGSCKSSRSIQFAWGATAGSFGQKYVELPRPGPLVKLQRFGSCKFEGCHGGLMEAAKNAMCLNVGYVWSNDFKFRE